MAESSDLNSPALGLSAEEKRVFSFLFDKADVDQLGVVTGERAVTFFERTGVQPQVLGEIWQIADTENRGFLSRPGFCIVLRLIGHYQAGREPSSELAFKSGPLPKFEGLQIPPAPVAALQPQTSGIRIPPLDPQKVAQYSGLFERSGAQNGMLPGLTAKAIFERAGLPVETLGKIWTLADREQRGALDQTEFIVAMHLLTSTKSRAMTALPTTLPQGFYDAAARRGAPPPPVARQTGVVARQLTGTAPVRTSSPLARSFASSGPAWLITPAEKAKYDQYFTNIDTQGRGVLVGEQAVGFFGDSGLPEDTLASIWDLADINSEGQLTKDEFAVAMYLIRQQRAPNAAPLPAFLPPALIPPSMRKANLQQQTQQTTAPAFETVEKPMPKSAADDLFGLDEPIAAPSKPRDPFATSVPSSPTSPARFQPQASGSVFKPFMPTSAFGATLATQSTGGSQTAPRAVASPSAMDDLLGDNDAEESNKLTSETTELANMSSQVGNLRTQMEESQTKKVSTSAELNASSTQRRELETRLQQFRAQYEQEVRAVKELEQQLMQSRDSTKKLGQELALLEGGYQDLQTQHQSISEALQADQAENTTLKQKIAELNAEVTRIKPEIEKMKLDARQQKGMVSINKKQIATNEAERDRLNTEKADLEREAAEATREQTVASPGANPTNDMLSHASTRDIASPATTRDNASPANTRDVASPAATRDIASPASILSSTNPFFRRAGEERAASPAATGAPSAFDQIFGPSFAQTASSSTPPATTFAQTAASSTPPPATTFTQAAAASSTPPATTFTNKNLGDSISSDGKLTPAATPPLEVRELPMVAEPPPPPLSRQFTPEQLPVGGLRPEEDRDETASTVVHPPASQAGDEAVDNLPGAFPSETPQPSNTDFDSAFANLGTEDKAKEDDPFTSAFPQPPTTNGGFHGEFPPIESLEHEEDSSDDEHEHHAVPARPQPATNKSDLPPITAQSSPPPYQSTTEHDSTSFPREFTGLLPARENPTSPVETQEEPTTPKAIQHQPPFPITTPGGIASSNDIFHDASSRPISEVTEATEAETKKNAFDDFDDFEDLADAKEDKNGPDFDFGFGHSRINSEFDAAFDSPAASTTTTGTNAAFEPSSSKPLAVSNNSSIQHTPEAKHDWDAIFSGLDNSTTGELSTSLGSDPWQPAKPATQPTLTTKHDTGRAITPGDEHDDPILKSLTGMGYARADALSALETYDYDIGKAVEHLSSK